MRIFPYFFEHENNPVFWSAQTLSESLRGSEPVVYLPIGEFDSGSERTLAAWFRHASRTMRRSNMAHSGRRVSNTWGIYPRVGDNISKEVLIPDDIFLSHDGKIKGGSQGLPFKEEFAAYQLVGEVMAHQGN